MNAPRSAHCFIVFYALAQRLSNLSVRPLLCKVGYLKLGILNFKSKLRETYGKVELAQVLSSFAT